MTPDDRALLAKMPTEAAALLAAVDITTTGPKIFDIQGRPHLLHPIGVNVVDLTRFLPVPPRLEQKVTLLTPDAFVGYVRLFASATAAVVFAQQAQRRFTAVLDYHAAPDQPRWKEHVATLLLETTEAWDAWTSKDGEAQNQTDFGAFLEERLTEIAEPDGAALLTLARHFEAKKDVTFKSVQRPADGSVQFTYAEDVQGTPRDGAMKMPTTLTVVVAPFKGGAPVVIKAWLRYRIADGGRLSLWYDLQGVDAVLDQAWASTLKTITVNLGDTVRAVLEGAI